MKIHVLNIDSSLQPEKQPFRYPSHSRDYGIEQDFFLFLNKNPQYLVNSASEADFIYLPVFWTRWLLNHDFGKKDLHLLQNAVDKINKFSEKTFTICQNDDGPMIDLKNAIVFLGSRKTDEGLDAPLLCDPHRLPFFIPGKKYLASFIGRTDTHQVRQSMKSILSSNKNILILEGNLGTRKYVKTMLNSYVALCPRGYGGSSFRFYEAMQLGVVPFLIGEPDTRPFKKFIPWEEISEYTADVENVVPILNGKTIDEWKAKGLLAKKFYENELSYGKWGKYVLKTLEEKK